MPNVRAWSTYPPLVSLANLLGVRPLALASLIDFESGWRPGAHNALSSARGLLQFTDATARALGYLHAMDLVTQNATIDAQLSGPVFEYLNHFFPFPTDQSLFMAVFYPDARKWPTSRAFPLSVQLANPGIVTPGDYIARVYRRGGINPASPVILALAVLGALGLYYLNTRGIFA